VRPWVQCFGWLWLAALPTPGFARAEGRRARSSTGRRSVDGRVITQSELELEARWRSSKQRLQAASAPSTTRRSATRSIWPLASGSSEEADKLQAYRSRRARPTLRWRPSEPAFQASPTTALSRSPGGRTGAGRGGAGSKPAHREDLDGKLRLRAQVSEAEVRKAYDDKAASLAGLGTTSSAGAAARGWWPRSSRSWRGRVDASAAEEPMYG